MDTYDGIDMQMAGMYFAFVYERHNIALRRMAGDPQPWTQNAVLASRKFTNVFRVMDPGSQYLLKLVNEPGLTPADVLGRAYLYRMTDHRDVWEYARSVLGRYPLAEDLGPDLADVWESHREAGGKLYSGAYMVRSHPQVSGGPKTRTLVQMAARLAHPDSEEDFGRRALAARTMSDRFLVLQSQKGIGPFMAMQVLTDFGYSYHGTDQDENQFVHAGPGARAGAAHLSKATAEEVIRWARECLLVDPPLLFDRPPSLMDVQNTFCEFGKYVRYLRSSRPAGEPYVPAHPGKQPLPEIPKHWRSS